MKNEIISLVTKTYTQDSKGVRKATDTIRANIPCEIKSAGSKEWFEGGRNGLNPVYAFIVRRCEYNNEETVIYNSVRYSIYRTYIKGDRIELHTQKEKGV